MHQRFIAALLISIAVHSVLFLAINLLVGPIMRPLEPGPRNLLITLVTRPQHPTEDERPEMPPPEPPASNAVHKAQVQQPKPLLKATPVDSVTSPDHKFVTPERVIEDTETPSNETQVDTAPETAPPIAEPLQSSVPIAMSPKAPEAGSLKLTQPDAGQIEAVYRHELLEAIARQKNYPEAARRRGLEGVVLVEFIISLNGEISQVKIERTSGSNILDRAAVSSVRRLKRFKPIPEALKRNRWRLFVTIHYDLE